ncbi:MAG: MarR family winged helix-turn-helix transcriptional regulator [Solirubrobacteraceae bacterium]
MNGDEAAATVPRALGHLRIALDDAYLRASRELGLTAPQAELLCAAMRPAAVGRLAETLRCDRTNVTHLVSRAVEHGWVERRSNDQDRRSSVIALTPTGEQLARRFIARLEAQLGALLATWSQARKQDAAAILREIAHELDRTANRAPTKTV